MQARIVMASSSCASDCSLKPLIRKQWAISLAQVGEGGVGPGREHRQTLSCPGGQSPFITPS
jgi:hypothetical protein